MTEPAPHAPPPNGPSRAGRIALWIVLIGIVIAAITFRLISSGGGPIREKAETFIRDINRGDLAAAKAHCTNDVDFETLERQVRAAPTWGDVQKISLPAVQDKSPANGPKRFDIAGQLEYANLRKSFTATMIEQSDGTYKISAYSFD